MTYDNPFPGLFPPKGYVENMKGVKYEILDYQQSKTRRGRRFVSFWFKIKYNDYDPYTLAKFKDRIVPICSAEADFTRCKINNLWKTKRPIR